MFPEPNRVTVEEFELPELTDEDVLIEIEYSAVSVGTERWCLTGRLNLPSQPPLAFPHAAGYQAAGIVHQIGSKVKNIKPGDRLFNRKCRKPADWKGSWWAGHAGFHVADYRDVTKLPDSVSTYQAASLLVAQVGFNGASKPKISKKDISIVIGAGLVGQFAAQVLRHRGSYVIITDLLDSRLQKAAQFSADEVFNSTNKNLPTFISEKYPDGVDIVLETAGSNKTIRMGIDMLKNTGQLVLNGFYSEPESTLDWHWLRTKEITTYCPNSASHQRLNDTADLIGAGKIKINELITHEFNFSQAPQAYKMLLDKSSDFLGIILKWN